MTGKRIYLILQAALCALLVALLCASAADIFREGSARRAEDPVAHIYTPEIVAERFAPIAPLCFIFVGLTVAGLLLGAKDENADRPVRDAASARDLVVARVARPSEAMRRERTAQRRLTIIGRGAFALCMVPMAVTQIANIVVLVLGIWLIVEDNFTPGLLLAFTGFLSAFDVYLLGELAGLRKDN